MSGVGNEVLVYGVGVIGSREWLREVARSKKVVMKNQRLSEGSDDFSVV